MDLRAELADWPVGSASVAVIGPAGVLDMVDDGRSHPWASVTKVMTALTVLDATFEGVIGLDDAVGPPGSTLRHLLSHASGLALDSDQVLARPGTRRIYSNRGIDLAAEHLGEPHRAAVRGRAVRAGAGSAGHDPAPSWTGRRRTAHGDRSRIWPRWPPTCCRRPCCCPKVVALASTVAFPGLCGVLPGFGRQQNNDWGLGCEIRDHKNPHWTAPGNSPARSGTSASPAASCGSTRTRPGLRVVVRHRFGPWAADRWPRLSAAVLEAYAGDWSRRSVDGHPTPSEPS